ncbi:MAG: hypothetical protein AAB886_01405 [Patescibacteria group bacterium]
MKGPRFSFIPDGMRMDFPCPSCERRRMGTEISVLSQDKERTVIHMKCGGCFRSMVATIQARGHDVLCMAMLSDWTASEAKSALNTRLIDPVDVLDIREMLINDKLFCELKEVS